MKTMFHHLTSCAEDLTTFLDETMKTQGRLVIESKEVFGRFTAESISSTALGFKGNCIKDKNSQVYKLAQDINDDFAGTAGALKMMLIQVLPSFVTNAVGIKIFRQSTHDFFKKFVVEEIARRESQGITDCKDVIQLLIKAKNGQLKEEIEEASASKVNQKSLINWDDDELIAAQVFIFFAGGFETTSTLLMMCSWELAMNKGIQEELMREVDDVLATLNGKSVSYEELNKMKLLEMVLNETLRKHPPLPLGSRECKSDYKLTTSDGQTIQFKKGDGLLIPFRCIQHDPKYFENPLKFDPYRFSEENKNKIVPGSFLSFGYGPRVCLGARLAMIEAKLVFFTVLSKYSIEICEKTPQSFTYSFSPISFKEDLFVELKARK